MFRKLSTFRGDSALSTWLHRIAVNTVLLHFRKKALKQVSLDDISNQDSSSPDSTPLRLEPGGRDNRLANTVERITLARAIRDLPAGCRTIFLLHEVEGYDHEEISQMLDCSVGNSKSQLYKARRRIREFLSLAPAEVTVDRM